jgi:hypothetical protein
VAGFLDCHSVLADLLFLDDFFSADRLRFLNSQLLCGDFKLQPLVAGSQATLPGQIPGQALDSTDLGPTSQPRHQPLDSRLDSQWQPPDFGSHFSGDDDGCHGRKIGLYDNFIKRDLS